ncbi:MAG: endolytic transglycosylase MltG [Balneolaceae bacterium]
MQLNSDIKWFASSAALFLLLFATLFLHRYNRLYSDDAIQADRTTVLYLHETSRLEEVMYLLEKYGVLVDSDELVWAASIFGWKRFQTGRYELDESLSYEDFLSRLALGLQDPGSVTIPPGIDIERFSSILSNSLRADSSSISELFAEDSQLVAELGLDNGMALFSRMLPNTYQIYWTARPERAVRRIFSEFERNVANRLESEIEESGFLIDEVLTLASIVEWEARIPSEKPRISGLYLNRLNRNMRLQADPTVIYIIGERRRLLYADYEIDHPYNTYQVPGLPPGPITNPDLSTIESVLNPEDHDYLFMVATPEGGHAFNRTYQEHLSASREWTEWLREQLRIRDQLEQSQGSDSVPD